MKAISGILAMCGLLITASPVHAVNIWTDTAYHALNADAPVAEQGVEVTVDWSYENYFAVWDEDHAVIGMFSNGIPITNYNGKGLGVAFGNIGACSSDPSKISFAVENFGLSSPIIASSCSSVSRDSTFSSKKLTIELTVLNYIGTSFTVAYTVRDLSGSIVASGGALTSYYNPSSNRDIWFANTGGTSCSVPMGLDCATYVSWTVNSIYSIN